MFEEKQDLDKLSGRSSFFFLKPEANARSLTKFEWKLNLYITIELY